MSVVDEGLSTRGLRALAVALGALALGLLGYLFARRVGYPYDLEWMEGGMLCHALRLVEHRPIYAPPSVDFIPYLYTPLYPALLAAFAKLTSLSYFTARLVSVMSFSGALLFGYVFARREGGSRPAAFAAMALPAAAFVPTGAWYDLARPDSLHLLLVTLGLLVGWWGRASHAAVIAAAGFLVAAFFTKQTASPFMVALGVALLVANRRLLPTYLAALAGWGLPPLVWLNHRSQGWFWRYIWQLHQQHDFYPARAFLATPARLALLLGPALLLVPWALVRRRTPGLLYATWIGLTGGGVAALGFGTQWAFTNAFIPGVFFPAIAIGVAAGQLVRGGAVAPPRLRGAAVYLLLATSLLVAPGGLLPHLARYAPARWGIDPNSPTGYDPRRYIPTVADRAAGDALIGRLRAAEGEVLIPFHPFYSYLAHKRTFLHRMGVLDIGRAGLGAPRGLADALRTERFSLAVFDNKIDGNWHLWPGLLEHYRVVERIAGPHVVSGSPTEPTYILAPRLSAAAGEP